METTTPSPSVTDHVMRLDSALAEMQSGIKALMEMSVDRENESISYVAAKLHDDRLNASEAFDKLWSSLQGQHDAAVSRAEAVIAEGRQRGYSFADTPTGIYVGTANANNRVDDVSWWRRFQGTPSADIRAALSRSLK